MASRCCHEGEGLARAEPSAFDKWSRNSIWTKVCKRVWKGDGNQKKGMEVGLRYSWEWEHVYHLKSGHTYSNITDVLPVHLEVNPVICTDGEEGDQAT